MNPQDVNAETPVRAVLESEGNQRALMTRLAMLVFGKADGKVIRAYTQFSPRSLAALIEGRRKGVFDYGETIQKLDVGGWTFPSDTDAVLRALDQAEAGEPIEEIDLEPLGVLDGDGKPTVSLERLFPSAGKNASPAKARPGPSSTKTVKAEPPKAEPPKAVEPPPNRASNIKVVEGPPTSGSSVEDHIERLSKNLGEVLEGMHNETLSKIQDLQGSLSSLLEMQKALGEMQLNNERRILALGRALQTFDRNVQQISMYFVDPGMEFETLDLEGLSLNSSPTPELQPQLELVAHEDADEPEDYVEPDEDIPEEAENISEESEDASVDRYTQGELEKMELQDLRAYAESIGVTPARWQKTNVNRILAEYRRLDGE